MRGRRRGTVAVLAVAVVLLAVTAVVLLGRSTDGGGTASSGGAVPGRAAAPAPADDATGLGGAGAAAEPIEPTGLGEPGAAAEPGAADVVDGTDPAVAEGDPLPVALQDRQVARTATLAVTVDDVDAAARRARLLGPQFGGYVESESASDAYASLTLRVASDSLDDALTALGDLGSVTDRQVTTDDVTEESVDVAARIESQRASVERVRALLAQAATVGEVVQVESELAVREADLRSLEQRSAALADAVSLSTVSVTLSEPSDGPSTGPDDDSGFLAGLAAGWEAFGDGLRVLLTVLGAVLPFVLVLGVPALAGALWWRRRRRAQTAPTPAEAA